MPEESPSYEAVQHHYYPGDPSDDNGRTVVAEAIIPFRSNVAAIFKKTTLIHICFITFFTKILLTIFSFHAIMKPEVSIWKGVLPDGDGANVAVLLWLSVPAGSPRPMAGPYQSKQAMRISCTAKGTQLMRFLLANETVPPYNRK